MHHVRLSSWWVLAFVPGVLLVATRARAVPIAYEGFAYAAGTSIDGAGGGVGWDTSARVLGSGGDDVGCSGGNCACPENPNDPKLQRGRSGAAWTSSSLNTTHNTVL